MIKKALLLCIIATLTTAVACSGDDDAGSLDNGGNDSSLVNDTTETTDDTMIKNKMNIQIGDTVLTATLVDNSSVKALREALQEAPITVNMEDYGNMEKVGSLGQNFPRNDEQITTEAGDIILYQGSALVIYYAPNSWSFTRLGKIDNVTAKELKTILGDGDVTVTLSLKND
jgi:hypothetical protein